MPSIVTPNPIGDTTQFSDKKSRAPEGPADGGQVASGQVVGGTSFFS